MALPQYATVPGSFGDTLQASFIAASATYAKVLSDVVAANTAAKLAGGARVYDITFSSTDATANAAYLWEGVQLSLYANMGTVSTTATSNATITRSSGSFITDGWLVGDQLMVLGSAGGTNNGNPGIITAVSAGTLTLNGVPSGWGANTEGSGFRVIRVTKRAPIQIAANAGNATATTTTVDNVQGISSTNDKTRDTLGIELGSNSLLLVSLYQATSALPATIQVTAKRALR